MAAWTQDRLAGIAALTQRQREVLDLIAAGRTNPEIAEALGVSLAGAKWHVREVITKLGVENRDEAAEVWREEHSLPRRFARWSHGILGIGLLKVAAGTTAVAGAGAMAVGGVAVMPEMRATPHEDPAPDSVDVDSVLAAVRKEMEGFQASVAALYEGIQQARVAVATYSRAEATAVGRELAFARAMEDSRVAGATFEERALRPSDFVAGPAKLEPAATFEAIGLRGLATEFPTGRNVWTVDFTVYGFETPSGLAGLTITVMFEDGQSTLIESWTRGPDLPIPVPDDVLYPGRLAGPDLPDRALLVNPL